MVIYYGNCIFSLKYLNPDIRFPILKHSIGYIYIWWRQLCFQYSVWAFYVSIKESGWISRYCHSISVLKNQQEYLILHSISVLKNQDDYPNIGILLSVLKHPELNTDCMTAHETMDFGNCTHLVKKEILTTDGSFQRAYAALPGYYNK